MGFPRSPWGLLSPFLTLHLFQLGSAELRVVGPRQPLLVTVGQDVVLPCHLSPRMDAQSLEIRWIRHLVSETVHLYQNGEDQYGEQMKEYVGRTELARDGLSNGSLDLRISELRPSDDGLYVCTVRDAGTYAEAMAEVELAGLWVLWCVLGTFQMSVGWCVPLRALSHPHVLSFGAEGQEVWKEVGCEWDLPIHPCPEWSIHVVLEVFLGQRSTDTVALGLCGVLVMLCSWRDVALRDQSLST
ncbi:PREDICTED: myelin-oligodendrocyte glycoprotein-like, partial [Calidris pugnax]|uniref:myelin-oligodendrocyte glycoprotein-like n=1 Tax=Calidris pugnax TaxID=198806 RepID=UPI00071C76EE